MRIPTRSATVRTCILCVRLGVRHTRLRLTANSISIDTSPPPVETVVEAVHILLHDAGVLHKHSFEGIAAIVVAMRDPIYLPPGNI